MVIHLRAAGVSVLVDARGTAVPTLIHWGRDLGDLGDDDLILVADAGVPAIPPSSIDIPLRVSLVPGVSEGWTGRPGLALWRLEGAVEAAATRSTRLEQSGAPVVTRQGGDVGAAFTVSDRAAGVEIVIEIELSAEGVLRVRSTIRNIAAAPLMIDAAASVLPVPERARELLDFSGLWAHEGRAIRRPLEHGIHSREGRHGRGGHDSAFVLVAGAPGFSWESGELWSVHAAWSGDTAVWAERSALGPTVLGAGELLAAGEVVLEQGEEYVAPWTVATYSRHGLNGISDRVHAWIRRGEHSPRRPRPAILNTWEAVYFDHSLEALTPLIDAAREVGVERFVLDDGWFRGRRDDRRALGDWTVDTAVWPDGLGPLIDRVHAAGMEFGLWVEPEMISLDSDAARRHPSWVLGREGALSWRHQHVRDLTAEGSAEDLFAHLDALLRRYDIAYLKWDHNRDLLSVGAHAQTSAAYALIDRLRRAHPTVEIESCASGGARLDLGMLTRVDRVWPSDTNDPLERQRIHGSLGLLIPPEYLGAHVGAPRAHTTGRRADLSFRLATALFGSAGIEWDISRASESERHEVAEWLGHYKRLRPLLHSGRVVRVDTADAAQVVHGVIDPARLAAVFAVAMIDSSAGALPPPVRFPGLDPDAWFDVRPLILGGAPLTIADRPPRWFAEGSIRLTGRVLAEVGLPMPLLAPEQAIVLELRAAP
ncbi:alpha-galactosidase [Microbacterium rhizomatis]|uniref:alpha-galactosidase n=1 Tax=Microbacterium rhizomatis TaxID=1631477 RepID=UPI001FE5AA1C|nr:alpha-galactosidase [Microbacterium rhizomatis]